MIITKSKMWKFVGCLGWVLTFFFVYLVCTAEVLGAASNHKAAVSGNDIEVAAYYFPNWGPVMQSEWHVIQAAKPQFDGHQQPKVPLWGYGDENDPEVMAHKIDAAADHGIDVFIFDWYYFNPSNPDFGGKYLYKALEQGFLNAKNNHRLKFSLMWCNHDVGSAKGAVEPKTFEEIVDYVIEKYFKHPSYWLIDGCPYFSIYQFDTFIKTFGGDQDKALDALNRFRAKVKAAGFPDLHINGVAWGLRGPLRDEIMTRMKIDSSTSYVWIHHNALPDFPASDYSAVASAYFNSVENGAGANGLEKPVRMMPSPYHINVTMGWDSSPRCRNASGWMTRRDYPFGPVIINNTPEAFKKALMKAKALTLSNPESQHIVSINSWNEWGEGSYLEPDTVHGYGYLKAVKEVFGSEH